MLPLPAFNFLSRPSLAHFLTYEKIFLLHVSLLISYLFISFLAYSFSRFLFRILFSFSTLLYGVPNGHTFLPIYPMRF